MPDTKSAWDYKLVRDFTKGLNLAEPVDALPEGNLVTVENLYFKKGEVRVDTGYKTFSTVVRGTPRATYQFYKKSGTSELLLITDATFYKYTSAEWQYVSNGTSTTCTDGEPAGETSIVVGSIAGFSDTDFIGIILDNGKQHRTTINGVPAGSTIVIADAIPAGRTVSVGAALVKASVLAGSLDILVSITTMAAFDWMIFTNGVDEPQRYDGTDVQDIPNLPSGGNTLCRVVRVFENHLLLMNVTEGGTAFPQRVRRSDTGDPTEWVTGNAGFDDLLDTEDFIIAAERLGPYMMIYRERSFNRMSWVGTADRLFNFDTTITGEGVVSTDGIIDLGDSHLVFGNANFYLYDGGFSITPVGDAVYDLIFGTAGELNPGAQNRAFGVYIEELDEGFFFYPSGSSTIPDKIARYSVRKRAWAIRKPATPIIGFGFFQRETSPTWLELEGAWVDQNFTWGSKLLQANSPTLQLCGSSPLQVYEYDFLATTDDGTAIAYVFETGDYNVADMFIRHNRLDLMISGSSVKVAISKDKGVTFISLATLSPGAAFQRQRIFHQDVAEQFRYRLTGSGGGFALRWLALQFKGESEW